ncbi:MAG: AbrB/MazE/SpoVT family DNA-binding domain-containing protein [Candidatus Heimdallarchaeota archaeon]
MADESVIQRRFTITIPRTIREMLNLREGEELHWTVENGRIIIVPKNLKEFGSRFTGSHSYKTPSDKQDVEKTFLGLVEEE